MTSRSGRGSLELAKSLDLIMTGGSDDHGTYLPGGPPGPAGNDRGLGSETTPPEEYERLLALAAAGQVDAKPAADRARATWDTKGPERRAFSIPRP